MTPSFERRIVAFPVFTLFVEMMFYLIFNFFLLFIASYILDPNFRVFFHQNMRLVVRPRTVRGQERMFYLTIRILKTIDQGKNRQRKPEFRARGRHQCPYFACLFTSQVMGHYTLVAGLA